MQWQNGTGNLSLDLQHYNVVPNTTASPTPSLLPVLGAASNKGVPGLTGMLLVVVGGLFLVW